jgi:hypothetical protein
MFTTVFFSSAGLQQGHSSCLNTGIKKQCTLKQIKHRFLGEKDIECPQPAQIADKSSGSLMWI